MGKCTGRDVKILHHKSKKHSTRMLWISLYWRTLIHSIYAWNMKWGGEKYTRWQGDVWRLKHYDSGTLREDVMRYPYFELLYLCTNIWSENERNTGVWRFYIINQRRTTFELEIRGELGEEKDSRVHTCMITPLMSCTFVSIHQRCRQKRDERWWDESFLFCFEFLPNSPFPTVLRFLGHFLAWFPEQSNPKV